MNNDELIVLQAKKIIKQRKLIKKQKKLIDLLNDSHRFQAQQIDSGIKYMDLHLKDQTSFTKDEINRIIISVTNKLTQREESN
ncbi:MAG: hypothetical protein DRG78_05410 [Epsilonproteobacteria bacterium]|nr:MAG: hypothetical protein DRG78_05410 [Campylobacterota bacterium]